MFTQRPSVTGILHKRRIIISRTGIPAMRKRSVSKAYTAREGVSIQPHATKEDIEKDVVNLCYTTSAHPIHNSKKMLKLQPNSKHGWHRALKGSFGTADLE